MRNVVTASLLLGVAVAPACGSSDSAPTQSQPTKDAGPVDDGGATGTASTGAGASGGGGAGGHGGAGGAGGAPVAYPAPHPAMPQVLPLKGAVLSAPKIVPISFAGDPLQASIDTFVKQMVDTTSYWSGTTAEYGVGPLTAGPSQHSIEAPPVTLTDAEVQDWLATQITSAAGFPQPDGNTIYAIFYPESTAVTMGGGTLCEAFQGYHGDFMISPGVYITYAVMGRCPPPVSSVTALDNLTAVASHEFIEAATDPRPNDKPAWAQLDADHLGWILVGGGAEIGDVCAPFPGVFYRPTGIDNLVQRVWSNKAAQAGHDPCEPAGASPYFNSAPDLVDSIKVLSSVGNFTTIGAHIPIGQSKTIALHLYSDAPTSGPWKVSVIDVSSAFFGGPKALSFKLDKSTGLNGDTIELTIKALSSSSLGASPFWIENDLDGVSTVWLGVVGN